MRALVTGGGGFIGSALARVLLERGDDVSVLDSFLTGARQVVPAGAKLFESDLRDLEAISPAFEGVDVVFHQAAVRSVPKSVDEPVLATECNVLGTLNVLIAAERAAVRRVVYASSSSVYGDGSASIQHEDAPPAPRSPYAASKLAGEYYCGVWTALKGLSTVSLRYFNVFGPGQHPDSKYSAVFPGFVSALVAGRAPELHWDGEQSRDFTYVADVVRANLAAAEAGDKVDGAVVNVAGGDPRTINEVLEAVSAAVGTWIEPRRLGKRAGDVRSTHADIGRARDLLGWVPETDWKTAVGQTVDWFVKG